MPKSSKIIGTPHTISLNVFGIATKYAESLISVKYRVQSKDGRMLGGAMYALERGLNMKKMAVAFALFAMIASL